MKVFAPALLCLPDIGRVVLSTNVRMRATLHHFRPGMSVQLYLTLINVLMDTYGTQHHLNFQSGLLQTAMLILVSS